MSCYPVFVSFANFVVRKSFVEWRIRDNRPPENFAKLGKLSIIVVRRKIFRAKTWFDKLMVRFSLTILSFCRRTTLSRVEGQRRQEQKIRSTKSVLSDIEGSEIRNNFKGSKIGKFQTNPFWIS